MSLTFEGRHGWTTDGDCKHVWVRIDNVTDRPVRRLRRPALE